MAKIKKESRSKKKVKNPEVDIETASEIASFDNLRKEQEKNEAKRE